MLKYELFKSQNQKKILALQEALTTQKWKAFSSIPMLLHHNHASLPGGGEASIPCGIIKWHPAEESTRAAIELFPDLRAVLAQSQYRKPAFLALYAMGSVGTSCFTSASDIDFWLIYGPGVLGPSEREIMEKKLRAIEDWAMAQCNLEMHVYLHDLAEIQRATFSYDKESAGDFGPILKEEFLRTAVHIAGAEPEFWGHTNDPSALDFGPIPRLTTQQYLAACLMLLEKALEKPFKAALKIALLRRLSAKPQAKLPAELYQDRVEFGQSADPYMLLLECVWEHFREVNAPEDLAFLKSVLYLKMVAEETSVERLRRNKDRLVAARFQSIGPAVDLDSLDQFFHWPFEKRIKFSEQIVRYLQTSLKEISSYPDAKFLSPLKIRSLTKKILIRRKAGNVIESLTFADVPSRGETALTFVRDEASEDWSVSLQRFAGRPDPEKYVPIKIAPSPVPLLAFALKNNLFRRGVTELRSYPSDIFPKKSIDILARIGDLLEGATPVEALESDAVAQKHLIVMEQPNSNKVESRVVTVLTRTSWGTLEYRVHKGATSLPDALNQVLPNKGKLQSLVFLCDVAAGPDEEGLNAALRGAQNDDPTSAWVVQDQTRYLMIKNRRAYVGEDIERLLLAMGSAGGRFSFERIPPDVGGMLLAAITKKPVNQNVRMYRFPIQQDVGFFIIDAQQACYAWQLNEEDARFSLMTNLEYMRRFQLGIGIECYNIIHKKGLKDPWVFEPFVPETRRRHDPATELHFELLDGGLANIQVGIRRIEGQPLASALHIMAKFIDATRANSRYYPAYLSNVVFPAGLAQRVGVGEAVRMKHELEGRIDQLRRKG